MKKILYTMIVFILIIIVILFLKQNRMEQTNHISEGENKISNPYNTVSSTATQKKNSSDTTSANKQNSNTTSTQKQNSNTTSTQKQNSNTASTNKQNNNTASTNKQNNNIASTNSSEKKESVKEATFTSSKIPDSILKKMIGNSIPAGSKDKVNTDNLSYLKITYWGFDNKTHVGEMIVHKKLAQEVLAIFKEVYEKKYPIEKMRLIDDYGAND